MITFQLFIHEVNEDVVARGLKDILLELNQDYVDSLILALDKNFTNKEVETVWKQAENEKNLGRANLIGIADLTEEKLIYLCEWSSIVPDIHQENELQKTQTLFRTHHPEHEPFVRHFRS